MGGSSGGGGGGAGAISWPAYLMTVHGLWLDEAGVDVPTVSLVEAMNAAQSGNSPYTTAAAYNPSAHLSSMLAYLTAFSTQVSGVSPVLDLDNAISSITNYVEAGGLQADATITSALLSTAVGYVGKLDLELDSLDVATQMGSVITELYSTVSSMMVSEDAYVTNSLLSAANSCITAFSTAASAMSPTTDIGLVISAAGSAATTYVLPTASAVASAALSYGAIMEAELTAGAYSTLASRLRDINAVYSSAYAVGLALIAEEKTRQVGKFTADAYLERDKDRVTVVSEALRAGVTIEATQADAKKSVAGLSVQLADGYIGMRRDHQSQKATLTNSVSDGAGKLAIAGFEERKNVAALGVQLADAFTQIRRDYQNHKWALLAQAEGETFKLMITQIEYERALAALGIENYRMAIVALSEQNAKDLEIDVADAKWDLDIFAYAQNLLAGPSGGTAPTGGQARSQIQTAIGGGLSGAAVGAMIGSQIGDGGTGNYAGAGGIIGGALGIASAFLT